MTIGENVRKIMAELPAGVKLVAAAKTKTPAEIREAIEAGIKIIGENYVQEAEAAYREIGRKAEWHYIGHLQKNKVKKAVEIFDMIETVDSLELAAEIDKRCAQINKTLPILIEVNSGRETQKSGVLPEDAEKLLREISGLKNVRVAGLMTMGALTDRAEDSRPFFQETKKLFDRLKKMDIPGTEMRYLSMGMSGSYRIAIEEGANMVRIGTRIFGERA
ncbi:MAG: YggS family pyridoxal phosphate-dependent enzyme [Dehalococcoidales bacterium]